MSEQEAENKLDDVTYLGQIGAESLSGLSTPVVVRGIDREAGVVIYASTEGDGGGVSTMPLSETNLE